MRCSEADGGFDLCSRQVNVPPVQDGVNLHFSFSFSQCEMTSFPGKRLLYLIILSRAATEVLAPVFFSSFGQGSHLPFDLNVPFHFFEWLCSLVL